MMMYPTPPIELAKPLRAIIDARGLRYLRNRHPMLTMGDVASGAGLTVVRVSDIEHCRGDKLTDAELLKLHAYFHKNGLNR